MSKKVKCLNCENCMRFAMIKKEFLTDRMKELLTKRIVCGITMKEKWDDNEQYCKYFKKAEDWHKEYISRERMENQIKEVEEG